MDKLYIVMPAYNEEDNIKDVVDQWYPVVEKIGPECRLVVVNDGSKDNTYGMLCELAKTRPQLDPVTKPNGGHGATVIYAYKYAIEHGADYIFQTDSDGQTLPEEFWPLWEEREQCGLLIGQRAGRKDGFSRVVVTRVLRLVIWLTFGAWVKDANTPFRLMKASQLRDDVLRYVPDDFNLSNVIITVVYTKHKLGVKYYPITFRPRQGGVNSINLKKIFKIGWKAVGDFLRIRKAIKQ